MTAPSPSSVRLLLLDLLSQSSRAIAAYHSMLRRTEEAHADLDTLEGFCEWAQAVLAEGRSAVAAAQEGRFEYRPSRAFSSEGLAARIRARRALSMVSQATGAPRRRGPSP